MDPYLERRDLWHVVHAEFIHDIRHALNPYLMERREELLLTKVHVIDIDFLRGG